MTAGHSLTLVTGAAGFIGFHVARALLDRDEQVIQIRRVDQRCILTACHAVVHSIGEGCFQRIRENAELAGHGCEVALVRRHVQ